MTPIIFGLISGCVAFTLIVMAERRQKSGFRDADGWKTLRPGWLLKATIIGSAIFAASIAGMLLSGGSTLPDRASQNMAAFLVLIGMIAASLVTAWTCYGQTISWKGDHLRVGRWFKIESAARISHIIAIEKSRISGEYWLRFRDGARLRFPIHLEGAADLAAALPANVRDLS